MAGVLLRVVLPVGLVGTVDADDFACEGLVTVGMVWRIRRVAMLADGATAADACLLALGGTVFAKSIAGSKSSPGAVNGLSNKAKITGHGD
jgi:hypothetical protein